MNTLYLLVWFMFLQIIHTLSCFVSTDSQWPFPVARGEKTFRRRRSERSCSLQGDIFLRPRAKYIVDTTSIVGLITRLHYSTPKMGKNSAEVLLYLKHLTHVGLKKNQNGLLISLLELKVICDAGDVETFFTKTSRSSQKTLQD